jgi:hypothetical protein
MNHQPSGQSARGSTFGCSLEYYTAALGGTLNDFDAIEIEPTSAENVHPKNFLVDTL